MNDIKEVNLDPNEQLVSLLLKYHKRIYGFILTLVPNLSDAEDILQESALVMCRRFREFQSGTSFLAWAITIARNQIYNYRKKHYGHAALQFNEDVTSTLISYASEKIQSMDKRIHALEECLQKLNQNDKKMIEHRYETGARIRDIARQIGRPEQGMYKSMARIHNLLRLCVERTLSSWETI
ncbi:sigma-70 family RNA polymerase sigma factor [Anaerohalosphaeraceae bacterium U12dextr]